MISNVSFTGSVSIRDKVRPFCKNNELKHLRDIAKGKFSYPSCDIHIFDRTYYADGTGVYSALVSEDDTGNHYIAKFDFLHPEKNKKRILGRYIWNG